MNKQLLVSGVRASGTPHIGNYLGGIQQFVQLQETYECYFFIADLHALTTPFDPTELRSTIYNVAADYIALGLDPKKCIIFSQSHVPQHAELAWIFNCITPIGELERMTQFKDKSKNASIEHINAGLLNYPVLMSADILLYKADVVPVGEDQVQHLELTRTIARKFNNHFGKTFPEPKPLLSQFAKIKSLTNPEKKMSKTGDEGLLIDDSPSEIHRKLKKAVTASDGHGLSLGVDNLFLLLKGFGTTEQLAYFNDAMRTNTIKFSELKETLATDISEYFTEFRERKQALLADPAQIARILANGAQQARTQAEQTMIEVRQKVGLL